VLIMSKKDDLNIKQLGCDAVNIKPVNVDWRELRGDDGEGWRSYEASECDGCGQVVVLDAGRGDDAHKDIGADRPEDHDGCGGTLNDDGLEHESGNPLLSCSDCTYVVIDPDHCDGNIPLVEGPMMNYYYPVKLYDCADAARKIAHLPLCVVEMRDGETGLALTGGGMDLSWEICEAFICLGYYPPAHFCDLPEMADKYMNERTLKIIKACQESCRILAGWVESRRERLAKLAERMTTKK
jgi:hypothetical protein